MAEDILKKGFRLSTKPKGTIKAVCIKIKESHIKGQLKKVIKRGGVQNAPQESAAKEMFRLR